MSQKDQKDHVDTASAAHPVFKTLGKLKSFVIGIPSAVAGILAVMTFLADRPRLLQASIVILSCLAIWAVCLDVFYAKKESLPISSLRDYEWLFKEAHRRIAFIGFFLAPAILVVTMAELSWTWLQPTEKTIILISNFDNPGELNLHITDQLMREIEALVKPYSEVQIKALHEQITIQNGGQERALSKGQEQKAAIVVWGYAATQKQEPTRIFTQIEIIHPLVFSRLQNTSEQQADAQQKRSINLISPAGIDTGFIVLVALGEARLQRSDFTGAINRLNSALLHKESVAIPSNLAECYSILAAAMLYRRNPADENSVIRYLNQSLAINPTAYDFNNLGCAFLTFTPKKFDDAVRNCERAHGLERDDPLVTLNLVKAYNERGWDKCEMGDLSGALADLNAAIGLKSDYRFAYNNRAIAYARARDYKNALRDCNTALALDADYPEALNTRGWLYATEGQLELAIADFQHAVRTRPGYGDALRHLQETESLMQDRENKKRSTGSQR